MFNLKKLCNRHVPASVRFEHSYIPVTETGCWLWIGATNTQGYGQINVHYKHAMAHRFAYEKYIGKIPEGLTLDHLCKVTSCVNPSHLEPVTMKENILRGEGPCAKHAKRTHCKAGHLLTQGYGQRMCRICHGKVTSRYYYSHKENQS